MTTCSTCTSWSLKSSPLARHSMASCALKARWEYLPPTAGCERHKPIEQAAADARAAWLGKIELKYKKEKS